jgi:hypothetical protein
MAEQQLSNPTFSGPSSRSAQCHTLSLAHDVITIEDGARTMPADLHRDPFGDTPRTMFRTAELAVTLMVLRAV